MPIPSALDINPFGCLDGQYAERHFQGKSVSDAVKLFKEQLNFSTEDLMHMGMIAFKYYVPAVIQYAESDGVKYDCSVQHQVLGLLNHRWHFEHKELRELRELFRGYCQNVLDRIGDLAIEYPPDYRLERQFRRFMDMLNSD